MAHIGWHFNSHCFGSHEVNSVGKWKDFRLNCTKQACHRGEALKVLNQGWEYMGADKRPEGVEFDDYVDEKIHLLKITENVKNKRAFLRTALKENYINNQFKNAQQLKAYAQTNQEIKDYEAYLETLTAERNDRVNAIRRQVLEENPDIINKALESV